MLHHYHNTSCGGTTMTTTNSTTSTSCGATPPSLPPLEAIVLIRYGISIQEARSIVAQGGANLKKLHNQKVVNSNDTSLNKEWTNHNDLKDECIRILKETRSNLNKVREEQHDDDEEEEDAIQCVPGVHQYLHQDDDHRRNSKNNYTLKRSPSMISQDAIASDLRSITESIQSTLPSTVNHHDGGSQSFCCGATSTSSTAGYASSPDQQQDELERRIWEAVAHYAEEVDGDNNNADVAAAGARKTKTKPVKYKKDWQLPPKSHRKKKYHHDNNDDDDTKATADDNSTLCFDNGIPRVIYIYYGRPTRQYTTNKVTGTAAASTLQQRRPSFFRRILMMAFGKNKRNRIQENDPECYEQTLVCL